MPRHTSTMTISLPKHLKDFVKERSVTAHYGTPSGYIQGLIREEMKRLEEERLEAELLKGPSGDISHCSASSGMYAPVCRSIPTRNSRAGLLSRLPLRGLSQVKLVSQPRGATAMRSRSRRRDFCIVLSSFVSLAHALREVLLALRGSAGSARLLLTSHKASPACTR
jgi:Arc/MetJ-type ribon-helix-helix transcriptional regulator